MLSWKELEEYAEQEVDRLLVSLPDELREPASSVVVFLKEKDKVEDGMLGLFEGADFSEEIHGHPDALPRITLFLGTICEATGGTESAYREEVRVTFLHELGHYFGWDEDEIAMRGLG